MDAYLIGVGIIGEQAALRILDLTKGATHKIFDYNYDLIENAVKVNKIQIHDLLYYNNGLMFQGKELIKPDIDNDVIKSQGLININSSYDSNKSIALRYIGDRVMISDAIGNLSIINENNVDTDIININASKVRIGDTVVPVLSYCRNSELFEYSIIEAGETVGGKRPELTKFISENKDKIYVDDMESLLHSKSLTVAYGEIIEYVYEISEEDIVVPEGVQRLVLCDSNTKSIRNIIITNSLSTIEVDDNCALEQFEKIVYPKNCDSDYYINIHKLLRCCKIGDIHPLENLISDELSVVANIKLRHSVFESTDVVYKNPIEKLEDLYDKDPNGKESMRALTISGIDLSKHKNIKDIESSFNNCVILGDVDFGNVSSISSAFRKTVFIGNTKIRFNDSLVELMTSFKNCNLFDITFDDATNLSLIDGCFHDLNLGTVDLSKCEHLTSISESFNDCSISKLILPKSLTSIDGSFNNNKCKIDEIILPECIKSVSRDSFDGTEIGRFVTPDNKSTYISLGCELCKCDDLVINCKINLGGLKPKHLTISDKVERLYSLGYGVLNVDNITYHNNIKSLGTNALSNLDGSLLDMKDWDIEELNLPDLSSRINSIVLPFKLKRINCSYKNNVLSNDLMIPASAEFSDSALKEVLNCKSTTFFISRENKTADRFKRRNNFKIFDTDEECYNAIIGTKDSVGTILKAKLVMSGSNDPVIEDMLKPENVDKVSKLRKIYSKLKEKCDDIELDYNKLSNKFTMNEFIDVLNRLCNPTASACCNELMEYYNTYNSTFTPNVEINELPLRYKSALKLISLFNDNDDIILNADDFEMVLLNLGFGGLSWYVFDAQCGLCCVVIKVAGNNAKKLVITFMNYRVISVCLLSIHGTCSLINTLSRICDYSELDENIDYNGVYNVLTAGDCLYSAKQKIGGDYTSELLGLKIDMLISKTCFRIDTYLLRGRTLSIVYDALAGKVAIIEKNKDKRTVIGIYNNSKDTEFVKYVTASVYGAREDMLRALHKDSIIEDLKNKDGAFDEKEPCLEFEIAKQMKLHELESVSQLNYPIMSTIFETGLFELQKISLDKLSRIRTKQIKLRDGSVVYTGALYKKRTTYHNMINSIPNYISWIVNPREPLSEEVNTYISYLSLDESLQDLLKFYSEPINLQNTCPSRIGATYIYDDINFLAYVDYMGCYLCELKIDGTIWLAYLTSGCLYKLMFRVKDMKSAVLIGTALIKSMRNTKNKLSDVDALMLGQISIVSSILDKSTTYEDFRNGLNAISYTIKYPYLAMLNGMPNGYKLLTQGSELFSVMAKNKNKLTGSIQ